MRFSAKSEREAQPANDMAHNMHETETERWGSDEIVELVRKLDFDYVALVPGSSFRGLHDSIVNYQTSAPGGNPRMLLCLHEEHAVAIAHGYAKVTEQPMLVALHSNVGIMHASMAIYNAFCDRAPIVIVAGTGPIDAARRRPWIDWIHTSQTLGDLTRGYTKWDDQPTSLGATLESIVRANAIARTAPHGPTLVAIDISVQEQFGPPARVALDPARTGPPHVPGPDAADVARTCAILSGAHHPVILAGRVSRDPAAWAERVALAERLGARVVFDMRVPASFPTDHPLSTGTSSLLFPSEAAKLALREADAILSLDYLDLAGVLKLAGITGTPTIVSASLDRYAHNASSRDHQAVCNIDLDLAADPNRFVAQLLAALGERPAGSNGSAAPVPAAEVVAEPADDDRIDVGAIGVMVAALQAAGPVCIIRSPIAGLGPTVAYRHPLDFLGLDGGGGIGSGPGMAVGAALALRDNEPERLPFAILGDGDFLMGSTAIWTAAANAVPLLILVVNNRSFFNDELHQERVARERGRPVERRWIGQRINGPAVDIAGHARSLGAAGFGPVERVGDLRDALAQALAHVRAGGVAVIDAVVVDGGGGHYGAAVSAKLTASADRG
jgi:thiamine pyrophosphate-dependent acetolactate synthase large subunit-like protein